MNNNQIKINFVNKFIDFFQELISNFDFWFDLITHYLEHWYNKVRNHNYSKKFGETIIVSESVEIVLVKADRTIETRSG